MAGRHDGVGRCRSACVNQLDLTNCRQTKCETLPTPVAGEAIGVQTFSRSAAVRVHVAPRESQLELKTPQPSNWPMTKRQVSMSPTLRARGRML